MQRAQAWNEVATYSGWVLPRNYGLRIIGTVDAKANSFGRPMSHPGEGNMLSTNSKLWTLFEYSKSGWNLQAKYFWRVSEQLQSEERPSHGNSTMFKTWSFTGSANRLTQCWIPSRKWKHSVEQQSLRVTMLTCSGCSDLLGWLRIMMFPGRIWSSSSRSSRYNLHNQIHMCGTK